MKNREKLFYFHKNLLFCCTPSPLKNVPSLNLNVNFSKFIFMRAFYMIFLLFTCTNLYSQGLREPTTVSILKNAISESPVLDVKIINTIGEKFLVTGSFTKRIIWGGRSVNTTSQEGVFLGKFTIGGVCTWLKKFTGTVAGSSIVVSDIASDMEGNIYLAIVSWNGFIIDGRLIPHTPGNIPESVLVKLTSAGEVKWITSFSSSTMATSIRLAITPSNHIICTGTYQDNLVIKSLKDTRTITATGSRNIFICSLSRTGWLEWLQRSEGDFEDNPEISIGSSDTIFIAAQFRNRARFDEFSLSQPGGMCVAKFDPRGICSWLIGDAGGASVRPLSMASDSKGNIFVGGHFSNTLEFGGKSVSSRGGYDIFISKILSTGVVESLVGVGSPVDNLSAAITIDKTDMLLLTGSYTGTAYFSTSVMGSTAIGVAPEFFIAAFSTSDLSHFWTESSMDEGRELSHDIATINGITGKEVFVGVVGIFRGNMYFDAQHLSNPGTNYRAFLLIKRYPRGLITPTVSSP